MSRLPEATQDPGVELGVRRRSDKTPLLAWPLSDLACPRRRAARSTRELVLRGVSSSSRPCPKSEQEAFVPSGSALKRWVEELLRCADPPARCPLPAPWSASAGARGFLSQRGVTAALRSHGLV